jgi:hypothetical protein
MTERFAQEALGHNSKAVHRAYAKRALMRIPSLEDYERKAGGAAMPCRWRYCLLDGVSRLSKMLPPGGLFLSL